MGKNRPPKNIRHLTRVLLIGLAFGYFHLSAQAAGQLIVHDFIPDLSAFLRSAPPGEGKPRQAICPASDQTTSGNLQSTADLQDRS